MKKKLLACLTTCSLLIAMFASTMTVNATSQTIKPIYQNELNQAGRNSQTSRGINIDAYVSASLNGVTSNSSKAADNPYGSTPASTYVYSTVANAGDLIDVNSKEGFYLDTVCKISIYDMDGDLDNEKSEAAINKAYKRCRELENTLSNTI